MNSRRTPRSSLHAANARPRNSGPLSRTMASGTPLALTIRSSTRRTRSPPSEVSTSMAGHSRVHSSTRVNIRITAHAITHEIHGPAFIRSGGGGPGHHPLPMDPPALSNPHPQSFLAVQPVHSLVVGRHSFPHQHGREPPIAEAHALGRQFLQAGAEFAVSPRFP